MSIYNQHKGEVIMENTPRKKANPKANAVAGEKNSTPANKAPRGFMQFLLNCFTGNKAVKKTNAVTGERKPASAKPPEAIAGQSVNAVEIEIKSMQVIEGRPWTIPDLNMQFVYVKPGTFSMGSNDFNGQKPVHQVTLRNCYWLGKYEVTQDEYQGIMGSNPSFFKGEKKPVETVTWHEAVGFCQKLTGSERAAGRLPDGYEYRLPTEAEWEFAARGGTASKGYEYSGSDNLDSVAWYKSNSGKETHEVGIKSPNELGIYDMSGNVLELCMDDWHENYDGAPSDGSRWGEGRCAKRVLRGGSWMFGPIYCRVADRDLDNTDIVGVRIVGFRVALAPCSK